MIVYDPKEWFMLLFRWRGSVVPAIRIELLLAVGFGFFAYFLAVRGVVLRRAADFLGASLVSLDDPDEEVVDNHIHSMLIFPLGFLLIFRSNNAYARYWEGRSAVGMIVKSCREIMRLIASYCEGDDEAAQIERAELRRLVNMLYAVIRQHLELEPRRRDLSLPYMSMVTPNEVKVLRKLKNRVSIVAQWLSFRLNESVRAGRLTKYDVRIVEERLNELVGAWMAADRIARTPLPYPYVQMLNLLLLIFVFSAPFTFARRFGGFTPFMSTLLAFALLGINAVASEIENPFGTDANDLPLEQFGVSIEEDTELILRQRDPDTEKYEKFWGKRALHQRLLREEAAGTDGSPARAGARGAQPLSKQPAPSRFGSIAAGLRRGSNAGRVSSAPSPDGAAVGNGAPNGNAHHGGGGR